MRRLATFVVPLALVLSASAVVPAAAADGVQYPSDATIGDPRGDAAGDRPSATSLRRADLIEVRYRAPRSDDGVFVVSAQFARLTPRAETGGPSQGFNMQFRSGGVAYELLAYGRRSRPVLLTAADDRRVRPERLELTRRAGPGGRLTVRLSVEFLTSRRIHVDTFGFSTSKARPRTSAYDNTPGGTLEYVD